MSDIPPAAETPPANAPSPATTSAVTTRNQHRKNEEIRNAEEDADSKDSNRKNPKAPAFKGKISKLSDSVFQLAEEGAVRTQFTDSLASIHKYMYIEYENVDDLAPLFDTPSADATIDAPPDEAPFLADGTTRAHRDHRLYFDWKAECDEYRTRTTALKTNKQKLFNTILLQCSKEVELKLEAVSGYADAKSSHDCKWLITTLKSVCHRFEDSQNRYLALYQAKSALYHLKQGPSQPTNEYYKLFQAHLSVIESYGGQIHDPAAAAPPEALLSTLGSDEAREAFMRDRACASAFLHNADPIRFGPLLASLTNSFALGQDKYPVSLSEAHRLLQRYIDPNNSQSPSPGGSGRHPRHHNRRTDGRGSGNDGRGNSTGRNDGRGAPNNRTGGRSEKAFLQNAFSLAHVTNHFPDGIPDHFVLLDSDSTVSIFRNPALLTNICDASEALHLETNGGGRQVTTQMGTIANFGSVWYNPDSIANILSLAQVRQVRRVTMDTDISPAFHVYNAAGTQYTVFAEHPSGLYLHDTTEVAPSHPTTVANPTSPSIIGYSYLQTVAENKSNFTKRQIEAADKARELYRMMGRPGPTRFLEALKHNHIINCPITVDDAIRAERIYGKDVAYLKGKSTASPANDHIPDQPPVALPADILSANPNVTLCIDIFYVLGLPFFLSTSRNIHYLSCRPLTARTKECIKSAISADLTTYRLRGFQPTHIHADGEFNVFKSLFPDVRFSICSADAHVPEVERAIRTIKDTVRSTIHGLPYHRLSRVLVQELVSLAIRTINMLPHADGISGTLSPSTIVTGLPKPDYNTMQLEFGSYVQVYDGTSNDTKSRTMGAIATNPTGNSSGDHFFMSIETGRRIHRRSWTSLPISDAIISLVEARAIQEDMPPVDTDHIIHEYDPDYLADESIYDQDFFPTSDPESDHHLTTDAYTDSDASDDSTASSDDPDDDLGHHPTFDDEPLPTPVPDPAPAPVTVFPAAATPPHQLPSPVDTEERTHALPVTVSFTDTPTVHHLPLDLEERAPPHNEERPIPTPAAVIETTSHPVSLRPKRKPNYSYRFGFTQIATSINTMPTPAEPLPSVASPPASLYPIQKAIVGLLFTQMSANKGLKKHGQAAYDALRREFEQFKAMDVLEALDAFTLTDAQKSAALRPISVIKEKRDGTIKGRTCADGSKQRGLYTKAETGSPTVSSDAFFLTTLIDAFERRDVATADIVGAYLHARMKEFISLRLTGWSVDLMCDVDPSYLPFVVYENNVKVLYVRANKAIYGCVVSGMLWYELFSETLEKQGFTINPYDFCVANSTINGSQCTIVWYVDDTKISHVDPSVVTSVITTLESHFGKMSVTRGSTHNFLGMQLEYLDDGTVTIHMPSYIQSAIDNSGIRITRTMPTPCANSLLAIDDTSPLLPAARASSFHSTVAKLIYVGTRARTDILLALGFLCSRVSAPTTQDELKLQRLLEYLHGTIDLKLRLGADSLHSFSTWVDASFAVHPDMRSHTGGVISLGRGGLLCKSKKQHINTKSSTEAELVGASDYLPNTLYVKMFLSAQGFPTSSAIFHQDNESAIKMEMNGKASCGQRSRHIDIRYFFITDHVKRHDIRIVHCPTADMLADFFTKPLQGSLFRKFRSILLGETHISTLYGLSPTPRPEERVAIGNGSDVTQRYRLTTDGTNADPAHSITTYPEE